MKKAVVFLLSMLLLCSCEENLTETANKKTVTFINGAKDADVWILPETEENLKTTVWGTATLKDIKTDESRDALLSEAGDDGLYILRMIDADSIYYSADGITLKEGWTVQIKGDDLYSVTVEVTDENGAFISTHEVFAASL